MRPLREWGSKNIAHRSFQTKRRGLRR